MDTSAALSNSRSDANVFVIFPGTQASSRCSKELGERAYSNTRGLKVSPRSSPLSDMSIISARLLAALYIPLMSNTMPHHEAAEARARETRTHVRSLPGRRKEEAAPVLMGTQLRVKNPYVCRQMYRSHRVELPGISLSVSCGRCVQHTLVTSNAHVQIKKKKKIPTTIPQRN